MPSYRAVFTRRSVAFVVRANDDDFAEIARWVDQIERAPSGKGDFAEGELLPAAHIQSRIHFVRGKRVMLDADLARY